MDLLLNDLSFHGQFQDVNAFKEAIERIMRLRNVARRFGREIRCHRNLAHVQATYAQTLPQVIQAFSQDESRALMQWFTRQGPFWEDGRLHSEDDYLEHAGAVVTDTALGEAAFSNLRGLERRLASLTPSSFNSTPLQVHWMPGVGMGRSVDVVNYWAANNLEMELAAAPAPIMSWPDLEAICRARCDRLTFADNCFIPLQGHPFVDGAARQILSLVDVLDRFAGCFSEDGQRSEEGQRLYQDHFTGDKAWFSDSSDAEKQEFKKDLTFDHPNGESSGLFCTWHGKVKTPQIRVHFSWPIRHQEPVYVAYIGPKITKR